MPAERLHSQHCLRSQFRRLFPGESTSDGKSPLVHLDNGICHRFRKIIRGENEWGA